MTNLTNPTSVDLAKWRAQATKAAKHVKAGGVQPKQGEDHVKLGFAFDDAAAPDGVRIITLALPASYIAAASAQELADDIYEQVLLRAAEP